LSNIKWFKHLNFLGIIGGILHILKCKPSLFPEIFRAHATGGDGGGKPNQTRTQQFARSFGLRALDGKQQIESRINGTLPAGIHH
jgi:hypothetical protein